MMGTRVLSLWLPYFAIDRVEHERAAPATGPRPRPRATCLMDEDDRPLAALCPLAERAGLMPGQPLADALAHVPGLCTFPEDAESDRRFLQTCASWCERYTPFVAVDHTAPGQKGAAFWLDIGSAAHLAGGEAPLLARLLGQFQKNGLTAQAAIADHPGAAWAACRFGGNERRILAANGARVALAPWPLEALRLERADGDRLKKAGLDRIEHLYALPRHSLRTRFGDRVSTRLDQALGLVDEPIARDIPLPAQQAQMIFADPITSADQLPPLIERLLRQLCIGLEAAGLGIRRMTLALYRVDNSTVTCSVGPDRPSRDLRQLSALIGDRFDDIDLGFGLERAILDAVEIEPLLPESIRWRGLGTDADDMLPDLARREHPAPPERRRDGGERRGFGSVAQLHQPASPFAGSRRMASPPYPPGGGLATACALSSEEIQRPVLQETPPRPLRLLRRPEAIEAIAPLPDEPPVLFRWRQRLHKVVGARGPETVAPEWWRLPEAERSEKGRGSGRRDEDAPMPRDYFAVEDEEGARFWLFREGRYGEASGTLPRWFLHGVFG